jgi:hypothetical protein
MTEPAFPALAFVIGVAETAEAAALIHRSCEIDTHNN